MEPRRAEGRGRSGGVSRETISALAALRAEKGLRQGVVPGVRLEPVGKDGCVKALVGKVIGHVHALAAGAAGKTAAVGHHNGAPLLPAVLARDEDQGRLGLQRRLVPIIAGGALLPQRDLLILLDTTKEASGKYDRPLITMSMGETGFLSRICGEFTGSALTFAAGRNASAPGQAAAGNMRNILENIHEILS